jgi:beta-D-xylosidase 4
VLLKNSGDILPLTPGKKVAVIGPHANATVDLISNYHGSRCPGKNDFSCIVTPFEAISKANSGGTTTIATGCTVAGKAIDSDIAAAVAAAKAADTVVLMTGIDQGQEREGQDRYNTTLPGAQSE